MALTRVALLQDHDLAPVVGWWGGDGHNCHPPSPCSQQMEQNRCSSRERRTSRTIIIITVIVGVIVGAWSEDRPSCPSWQLPWCRQLVIKADLRCLLPPSQGHAVLADSCLLWLPADGRRYHVLQHMA